MTEKGRKTCRSDLFSKQRSISLLHVLHQVPIIPQWWDMTHYIPNRSQLFRIPATYYLRQFISFTMLQPKHFHAPTIRKRELFPHQLWSCVTLTKPFFGHHTKKFRIHTHRTVSQACSMETISFPIQHRLISEIGDFLLAWKISGF